MVVPKLVGSQMLTLMGCVWVTVSSVGGLSGCLRQGVQSHVYSEYKDAGVWGVGC